MKNFRISALSGLVMVIFLLTACTVDVPAGAPTATPTREGTLRPYPTGTSTATPLPTGYNSPTPSPTVTPTPTPVYYDVQEKDDMYGIAFRFGISPDVLMTANPTVNPRAMGVGTTLLIPITPMPPAAKATETPVLSPTPTPPYAALHEPNCYPDASGGLWCFVLVENNEAAALENVSGVVKLEAGEDTREEIALMPLNLLPAGASLPLIAYFQPPLPENFTATAQVDFLLPVMPEDQRYLTVEITRQRMILDDEDRVAEMTGELFLLEGQPDSRYVWVNATAFDAADNVVATRRWESDRQLSAGETLTFNLFLYSLKGTIDHVDLLVEARPVFQPTSQPQE